MIKISSVAVGVILAGLDGVCGVGLAAQRAGESRSVPRAAQIDGNQAGQGRRAWRSSTLTTKKAAERKPEANTAGRARIYADVASPQRRS